MKNKIFFIMFMFVWITLILLNFILPKQTFSEQENRYLSKLPSFNYEDLVNGVYSENLDTFINDHFVFRNFFLKLNSFLQVSTGKAENNDVYIGKDGYLFEKFDYNLEKEKNIKKNSLIINDFAKKIEVPSYFMLIPNSIYINKNKLPENVEVASQNEIINDVYDICKNTINVYTVPTLLKNKNKDLYFKTDHHMTSYGSYLIYQDFCKKANIRAVSLRDFKEKIVAIDFLGTLDSKAQIINQEKDIIKVYKNGINENIEVNYDGKIYNSIFNKDYLDKKDKYSYFLNGNNAKVVVKTKINNSKKLLVIKDSYAHILSQFLCQNYEEVHFIDPRYYNLQISDYVEENNITETLFVYNVSNLMNDTGIRLLR